MRGRILVLMFGALLIAACGTTRRTTVVAAPEGSTVVVPSESGDQGDRAALRPGPSVPRAAPARIRRRARLG